ncbi:unnamed protein product [Urochloa decumbens]|uniref:Uncharacterized protein n=1 Tax=Urochloa decumbens TaxID=240449 RepID=A0ABC9DWP7_9POAL
MAENRNRGNTWVAGAGFGLLTVNSGLAIYRARGDPASVLFVAGRRLLPHPAPPLPLPPRLRADAARVPGRRAGEALVAAFMPSAVAAAVVWALALATVAGGFFALTLIATLPASATTPLTMAALGAMACDTALAVHDALGGLCCPATATLVLVGVAYAAYLALTFRFVLAFAGRARAVEHGRQVQGRGVGAAH